MSEELGPSVDGEVQLRKRRLWGFALWALAVIGGAAWMTSLATRERWTLAGYGFFVLVGGLGVGWRMFEGKRSKRHVQMHVDRRGVVLDGKMALAIEDLAEGAHLRPIEDGGTSVRIPSKQRFGGLELGVADEAEGEKILEALGQDPARAKVRFRLAGGFENKTLRQVATVAMGLSSSCGGAINGNSTIFHALFVVWAIGMLIIGASFLLPTYVTVGADGLFIERRARRRFVPFTAIKSVDRDPAHRDAVVVTLADDEEIVLRTMIQDRNNVKESDLVERRALELRIDKSLVAFRARSHEVDASLFLKRGGRSAKAWMDALEKLRLERGYREARVTDDQLWQVLEDPAASAEDRAAALVALRGQADDAGKTRRRIALEASAEPRLRVVLDAAETEDAAALEAALEGLHDDEEAKKT